MKFRLKVTLCMICLMTLLFSIGSCALISISFHSSLNREQAAAQRSYQMLLNTLQVVGNIQPWDSASDLSDTLEQLSAQQDGAWAGMLLNSSKKTFYSNGPAAAALSKHSDGVDTTHCVLTPLTDPQNRHYLQLSRAFVVGEDTLYLTVATDLSYIYETRERQASAYFKIFVVLVCICSLLAYSISHLLTRPLNRLSKASREIAAGHLEYRVNLHTKDEIGLVAQDFDAMAERVQASVVELQAAMDRQVQFVSSFTHELKTPMTSIIGYADLLRSQALTSEEQLDAANYIFSEGRRLERLSLTLLDIFVAEQKTLALTPLSPSDLVTDLVSHLRPYYLREGILLHCQCQPGSCLLEGDLIRSLLLNLLDNARKALEHGGTIWVQSELTPEGCILSVRDNGRGIPPQALEHLTEAFYRVDKSRSRLQGGAGLGLTLCAKIAALHHGSLRFDSVPGQGTTVTVILKGGRG